MQVPIMVSNEEIYYLASKFLRRRSLAKKNVGGVQAGTSLRHTHPLSLSLLLTLIHNRDNLLHPIELGWLVPPFPSLVIRRLISSSWSKATSRGRRGVRPAGGWQETRCFTSARLTFFRVTQHVHSLCGGHYIAITRAAHTTWAVSGSFKTGKF